MALTPRHSKKHGKRLEIDEYPVEEWREFTLSLRLAIRSHCTSAAFDANGFPRYVWGLHRGRLFQARHRTDPPGTRYKGWWIDDEETPSDPDRKLAALRDAVTAADG